MKTRLTSKPILFLHGVGGHATEFDDIIEFIKTKFGPPNQQNQLPPMYSIDICDGSCSIFTNMIDQRTIMTNYLTSKILEWNLTNGYHWVAHSQGSVLARAVIQNLKEEETDDNNNNDNNTTQLLLKPPDVFISMAGPQMGQWGNCSMSRTDIPERILKSMTRPLGWIVFYNILAQQELSIANYWHDPNHYDRMIEEATLLPILNGYGYDDTSSSSSLSLSSSPSSSSLRNTNTTTRTTGTSCNDNGDNDKDDNGNIDDVMQKAKRNFLRIQKAVFVGSEDDDCINPPLSSVFQFVDTNENPVPMEDTMEYTQDTFGLRTMMEHGRLFVQNYPKLHHLSWRHPNVFERYVLPHLMVEDDSSSSVGSEHHPHDDKTQDTAIMNQ